MFRNPRHQFQVLTKRPERMAAFVNDYWPTPPPNVWLGTSVENQEAADERIPHLQATPAAVRFLSCEPLLGPLDLSPWMLLPGDTARLDWIIVGGESGRGRRDMKLEWLEAIVTEAQSWGVPVFVKQDMGALPGKQGRIPDALWIREFPETLPV
jgi:protein gp37